MEINYAKQSSITMYWGADTPPETGYVKAKLTIESEQLYNVSYYGYSDGLSIGSLNPQNGVTYIYLRENYGVSLDAEYSASSERPFYYDGQKYTNGQTVSSSDSIYNWKNMIGQTVDVWIAPE